MSFAAAASAAAPSVDAAALQAWCLGVDGRLDAADHAIAQGRAQLTDTNLALAATIEQAKMALNAIVDGVRVEVTGIQGHFRADSDLKLAQLSSVVTAAQEQFAQVEGSLSHVTQGLTAKMAEVEARVIRAEQRVDQLLLAGAPPLGTAAARPPRRRPHRPPPLLPLLPQPLPLDRWVL